MSTHRDLSNQTAIEKLKELAEGAGICMMSTDLDARPIPSRPMSLQEVDANGTLWFISSKTSDKNYDLKKDAETQLFFNNDSGSEYLSVFGKAEIYTDPAHIEQHWSPAANAWFDGKDDPDVSIIGVRPLDVRYWESEHGKLVNVALMAYSAVTGEQADDGVKGKLNVGVSGE